MSPLTPDERFAKIRLMEFYRDRVRWLVDELEVDFKSFAFEMLDASVRNENASLKVENARIRDLYENALGFRERFGTDINHLLEADEALRGAEDSLAALERERDEAQEALRDLVAAGTASAEARASGSTGLIDAAGERLADALSRAMDVVAGVGRADRHSDVHPCQDCGVPTSRAIGSYWLASDELWAEVVGDNTIVLCPAHFHARAEAKGITVWWQAEVEGMERTHTLVPNDHADSAARALRRQALMARADVPMNPGASTWLDRLADAFEQSARGENVSWPTEERGS